MESVEFQIKALVDSPKHIT